MSQTAFADLFGLTRASIGSYEEGRAEPRIDTIIQIANHFSITLDQILKKEMTVNELYQFDIFKDEFQNNDGRKNNLLVRKHPETKMAFVGRDREEAYLQGYEDEGFIKQLPQLQLPVKLAKGARAFEHFGHEMQFDNRGLLSGDIIVAVPFDAKALKKDQQGFLFTIVTENGIFTRRLGNAGKEQTWSCDNTNGKAIKTKTSDLLEVWEVVGVFSTNLQSPGNLEERLSLLEQQLKS